ncbi:hypothetical protein ANO11243_005080 [Dothideomycetidae sp. 11243]|nr:hypothetical protein ANO11243_005080 [fungal sp. No.11243]
MSADLSPHSWLVSLEFHDDNFSRDAVVINVELIPGCDVPLGSLARVAPYHPAKLQASGGGISGSVRQVSDQYQASDTKPSHGNASKSDGTESEVSRRTATSRGAKRTSHGGSRSIDGDAPGTMDHARSLAFRVNEMTPDQASKKPHLQISLHSSVKTAFHLSNRQQAVVYAANPDASKAGFVELAFRDQYLSRADMWQLAVAELANRSVFRGQQLLFMGTIKARVKNIFVRGRKVNSAVATPATVPIFRSESAKYVFFIQMSREMWEYDAEGSGEIMFNKVINGFLPDLFKRWQRGNVRHLVSIILFSRIEYEKGILKHIEDRNASREHGAEGNSSKEYRDYYRVVTTDMASSDWVSILYALKKEFKVFLRDTLILPGTEAYGRLPDTLADVREASEIDCVIAGRPTIAAKGNVLECINLASSQFAQDYMDRDLVRTGISLVIITGGTGVFEVDYRLLKLTTDTLVGNGIGIDLVALAPMPLHSVPLFRYKAPKEVQREATSYSFGSTPRNMAKHQMPSASPEKNRNLLWGAAASNVTTNGDVPEAQWYFALPHWIDVSFWTGEVSDSSWEDMGIIRRKRHHRAKGTFTSSCRMYELQMMGLMEIEMSDISITLLNAFVDPTIPPSIRPQLRPESSGLSVRKAYAHSHLTPTGSPEKRNQDTDDETGKTRTLIYRWMEAYEDEYFPGYEELRDEYEESVHSVRVPESDDAGIRPLDVAALLRQLIAARLSNGFQIVVGSDAESYSGLLGLKLLDCFQADLVPTRDHIILLSVGNDYHQLQCLEEDEVLVKTYEKRRNDHQSHGQEPSIDYRPRIRTMLAETYERRKFVLRNPRSHYDWNMIDAHCAGGQADLLNELRYWRARFVLIPVDIPKSARGPLAPVTEVSDEETRLEGIQKLTQMWQRYKYLQPGEKRFQNTGHDRHKDMNPLAIDYQTRDPSAVIRTYAAGTIESLMHGWNHAQLFGEAELYHSSDVDLQKLAQHLQARPPRGVTVVDRRWHWKVYYRCFRGDEFTTWLLANFKDMETRDDATKLGNELMKKGLFTHVSSKHHFRDGNYFYQVASEYRTTTYLDSKLGWFGRMTDRSAPGTPSMESTRGSPLIKRPESRQSRDESSGSSSGDRTPTKERSLELSRMLQYDVDPRNKSWRPEIINLHYDRLHNPDNCYHIRVDWMNVTSKLIEDVIVTWASSVERYGLKLVEVPIGEASQITGQHPFRAPYRIELAVQPPKSVPRNTFEPTSSPMHVPDDTFAYHKALLRKWDFVLDTEAARSFDCTVPVTYSWGKPDYKYTQFIHKTGTLLVEIDDEGRFLLLANRLCSNRAASNKETHKFESHDRQAFDRRLARSSPYASPLLRPVETPIHSSSPHLNPSSTAHSKPPFPSRHATATSKRDLIGKPVSFLETRLAGRPVTPETIKDAFEKFCGNRAELESFYETALKSAGPSPRQGPADRVGSSPRITPVLRGVGQPGPPPRLGVLTSTTRTEDIPTLGLPERRMQLSSGGRAASYSPGAVTVAGTLSGADEIGQSQERERRNMSIAQLFGGRPASPREALEGQRRASMHLG